MKLTFPEVFRNSAERYSNNKFITFVDESALSYAEASVKINAVTAFLEQNDIKPGDKVAILSLNMPNWSIAYFGITFMGAVAVPILPDFSSAEIENVLQHSEAKAIFVSQSLIPKLDGVNAPDLKAKLSIEDFELIGGHFKNSFVENATPQAQYEVNEDDLALIIYTSGTTGKSKGVMLSHKNVVFDAIGCGKIQPINEKDRFLSILPLSHAYENTLGLILPMMNGASVHYLRKPPIPAILLPALKSVKPTIMLTVPLIIEKIYRNKIAPSFNKNIVLKSVYRIPFFRKKLNAIAGKKLMETFGGELVFFGVGGSKLDKTVERFLIEAKFPYAIGYGLTETAPLIAGVAPHSVRLQSTGPQMEGIELIINNPDPKTGEGEVWARGANIMKGYYKEPELTAEVITEDGWFKTGDLAIMDKNNFLYIKGRSKNMIVGANGENIYPEEIESVINNFKHVVESLVLQRKGKLVALVHFNMEELEERYKHLKTEVSNYLEHTVEDLRQELQSYVNSRVNKFSRVQLVIVQPQPFQKTATQKIKRFLYN